MKKLKKANLENSKLVTKKSLSDISKKLGIAVPEELMKNTKTKKMKANEVVKHLTSSNTNNAPKVNKNEGHANIHQHTNKPHTNTTSPHTNIAHSNTPHTNFTLNNPPPSPPAHCDIAHTNSPHTNVVGGHTNIAHTDTYTDANK